MKFVSKTELKLFLILVTLMVAFLALVFFEGKIKTINGLLIFLGLFLTLWLIPFLGTYATMLWIGKQFPIKPASKRELEKEDDILLQATGFSQSVLIVYLSLIPQNDLVNFLKGLVLTVAISFYVIRAYAKLKNNNKYRFYSMRAITFMIVASAYSLFSTFLTFQSSIRIVIDDYDATTFLLPMIPFFFGLGTMNFVEDNLRDRYLSKRREGKS